MTDASENITFPKLCWWAVKNETVCEKEEHNVSVNEDESPPGYIYINNTLYDEEYTHTYRYIYVTAPLNAEQLM